MQRTVQFLLLVVFAGTLFAAEEETMEERKQRIRRKYLRQRADITFGSEVIPEPVSGDDEEDLSSTLPEEEVDLSPAEAGVRMPPPVRRPPQTVNRNWLLDVEGTGDPYANPYGQQEPEETPKQQDWNQWNTDLEPTPYSGTFQESSFTPRSYETDPQSPLDREGSRNTGGIFSSRNPYGDASQQQPVYPQQDGQTTGGTFGSQQDPAGPSSYNPFSNPFQRQYGQQTESQQNSPFGTNPQTAPGRYTPYRSPFQTRQEQSQENRGYTPYKSPYQTQQEQRQEQSGSTYNQQQQEFQRQNSYQQWKKRNPSPVNPMSDDAYIQEMMPQNR